MIEIPVRIRKEDDNYTCHDKCMFLRNDDFCILFSQKLMTYVTIEDGERTYSCLECNEVTI